MDVLSFDRNALLSNSSPSNNQFFSRTQYLLIQYSYLHSVCPYVSVSLAGSLVAGLMRRETIKPQLTFFYVIVYRYFHRYF